MAGQHDPQLHVLIVDDGEQRWIPLDTHINRVVDAGIKDHEHRAMKHGLRMIAVVAVLFIALFLQDFLLIYFLRNRP